MIVVMREDLDQAYALIADSGISLLNVESTDDHLAEQKQIHFDYAQDEDLAASVFSDCGVHHTLRFR